MIQTWTFHFEGHWPVGACGLVMAETVDLAVILAEKRLKDIGLPQKLDREGFTPVPTGQRYVRILLDGEY